MGRRYTAAVLRIERGGRLQFERAYGRLAAGPGEPQTEVTTRFDLASLTKLFTAAAALELADAGAIALDDSLVRWFPEWRSTPHAAVTLRMLLAHTSGMQSGADYRALLGRDVERFARELPLVSEPAERVLYSDIGFIVLGTLIGRISAMSLARSVENLCRKTGAEATAFRPRNDDPRVFPATEADEWRGRVRGSVHDEKAHLMGGVAGHAGLFGTAYDVARLTDAFLAPRSGRRAPLLSGARALEATSEQGADPVLRRGLGWALKTSDENSCGAAMDRTTFGHTGFTGTSVWADPVRDLSVVFLTNAVYFGRLDLRDVRAAVCDAAVREAPRLRSGQAG